MKLWIDWWIVFSIGLLYTSRFDFLTQKQANIAMDYFFGIKDFNLQLKGLTSGDFATVKKKVDFLGTTDVDEITKMLSEEVKVKKSSELKNSIGF